MTMGRMSILQLYAVVFIIASMSSFTDQAPAPEVAEKKPVVQNMSQPESVPEIPSSLEDSKEKRSQEEILYGNQQNKPNGLVDDVMDMSGGKDDSIVQMTNHEEANESKDEAQQQDVLAKEEEKRSPGMEDDMMMGSGAENWYNAAPVPSGAMQYFSNPRVMQLTPDDFASNLYDQEDIYRRKRQLVDTHHPYPLQKRSLRSSLGQMIQKRGIRLPRRSMRLKRQTDMQDLLNMIGNDRYYEDDVQMTPHIFSGRSRTVAKRHVPGHFSGYPEAQEYQYPFIFQHRGQGVMPTPEGEYEEMPTEDMEEMDDLMLLPPNNRYIDASEVFPYRNREEENEAIQKWMSRHTTPSLFRVSRRSSFYPIDYRYIPIPGYKKRSAGFGGRRAPIFSGEEIEPEVGKWGHIVQVPEAYASTEDVARLYGLANLMAEGENSMPESTEVKRAV